MKIGIVGCAGRMGSMLVQATFDHAETTFIGGTEPKGSPMSGKMVGGKPVLDDPAALFEEADAVIDFTAPAATVAHAALAAETGTVLVVGTTGLTAEQQAEVERAAEKCVIVQAANFSIGVNLLIGLTRQVAGLLDDGTDIEIVEMHHKHKVDAPSGTALALGKAAAEGRGVNLDEVADKVRDGQVGAREQGAIGFATLRGGDVVGDHTVIFAHEGERLELTHKAASRMIFASGAVRAAVWGGQQKPGHYSMADVLGFTDS
ncbi:MAG: 4-hydroxy-tetrahydrodipicolinate reductase [Magnetovibrionaceae bacterium]